jgi:hypothetical protein
MSTLRIGQLVAFTALFVSLVSLEPLPAAEDALEQDFPRLPGSASDAPAWAKDGAPFDVPRFFRTPARELNAERLYLDAFSEFGGEMMNCFPASEKAKQQQQAVKARQTELARVEAALVAIPHGVSAEQIDALLVAYGTGFRKLIDAQKRPQCVFATGVTYASLLPHVQASRVVVRALTLKVQRELARRDISAAVNDVGIALRMTRDIQPRGGVICQLVAAVEIRLVVDDLVGPILASRDLQVQHCDRLLTFFETHRTSSIDAYTEALKVESLIARVTLRDLISHQDEIAATMVVSPGDSVVAKVIAPSTLRPASPDGGILPPEVDAVVARTTPAELAAQDNRINAYYRTLLDLSGVPLVERLKRLPAPAKAFPGEFELLPWIVRALQPSIPLLIDGVGKHDSSLAAGICLIALRRRQLLGERETHNLTTALKEAGLKGIPADPYDGQPLRLAVVNGDLIVYTIGKDGNDDGGLKDSHHDQVPGDLIFRLPSR